MASPERVAEPREGYVMASVKTALLAGVAALLATAANAADLPLKAPPLVEYAAGGWYLRGDIGMTNQDFNHLHQRLYDVPGTTVDAVGMGWDSSMLFGLGVGYQYNNWLRFDVTGEYRGKSNFHGSDHVTTATTDGVDNYSGSKSEWVVMANGYVDLGTWYNITPYVGAGVGAARVSISGFRDDGFNNLGISTAYAEDASKWNFAWALHAGLTYQVTQALAIDFGYRYIDLGNATTGPTRAFDGSFTNGGPFTFHHIYSHDLKLGIRWMLEPPMPMQPVSLPPLMRRG
jgi:opacity protein-like surface antigen